MQVRSCAAEVCCVEADQTGVSPLGGFCLAALGRPAAGGIGNCPLGGRGGGSSLDTVE